MPVDRGFVTENERELDRLRRLVGRLITRSWTGRWTPGGPSRACSSTWRFWDYRIVTLLDPLRADHRGEHLDELDALFPTG